MTPRILLAASALALLAAPALADTPANRPELLRRLELLLTVPTVAKSQRGELLASYAAALGGPPALHARREARRLHDSALHYALGNAAHRCTLNRRIAW